MTIFITTTPSHTNEARPLPGCNQIRASDTMNDMKEDTEMTAENQMERLESIHIHPNQDGRWFDLRTDDDTEVATVWDVPNAAQYARLFEEAINLFVALGRLHDRIVTDPSIDPSPELAADLYQARSIINAIRGEVTK